MAEETTLVQGTTVRFTRAQRRLLLRIARLHDWSLTKTVRYLAIRAAEQESEGVSGGLKDSDTP